MVKKAPQELVTQAEFARQLHVSKTTVSKWKKRGWLTLSGNLIDAEATMATLDRYRQGADDAVTLDSETVTLDENAGCDPQDAEDEASDVADVEALAARIIQETGAPWTRDEALRIRDNYAALRNRLTYDLESRAVVMRSDVLDLVRPKFAQLRTKALAVPAERAPEIHRCRTVEEVRECMERIMHDMLKALSEDGLDAV